MSAIAVVFSLGIHSLVLALFFSHRLAPLIPSQAPLPVVTLSLPEPPPERLETTPVPAPPPLTPEPWAAEQPTPATPADEPAKPVPPSRPSEPSTPAAAMLRQQALGLARSHSDFRVDEPILKRPAESVPNAGSPRLPGKKTRLEQFAGPVTPSVETWQSETGEFRQRIVTASGRVYCTRRGFEGQRAVSSGFEIPSGTFISLCGRARPSPRKPGALLRD